MVAFRLFLAAAASHPESQAARLRPVGLTGADVAVLSQALPEFASAMRSATASGSSLDAVATRTMQSLSGAMSPAGYQSLVAYVRAQKQFMKRVPYPNMLAHQH